MQPAAAHPRQQTPPVGPLQTPPGPLALLRDLLALLQSLGPGPETSDDARRRMRAVEALICGMPGPCCSSLLKPVANVIQDWVAWAMADRGTPSVGAAFGIGELSACLSTLASACLFLPLFWVVLHLGLKIIGSASAGFSLKPLLSD